MVKAGSVVVMGPSGCGKSTLGTHLATALGWSFIEGDDLHSAANVAKMSAGTRLTDEDRWPWLDRIAHVIREHAIDGSVTSCSALKRIYRDRLRAGAGTSVAFILPDVDKQTLHARLTRRKGHYAQANLLDGQWAALEPPGHDELACRLDGTLHVEVFTQRALDFLARL